MALNFSALFSFLGYIAAFLVVIGILVTVHEYGHFWVARRLGVKVLCFSVGFGKPLWQRQGQDGVCYQLARFPLGGYVKMLGEERGTATTNPQAFINQSVGRRAAIVAAGPAANFALAILLYWLAFVVGIPGIKPIIGEVKPHSIAAQSGLQPGDHILKVGDQLTSTWGEVIFALLSARLRDEDIHLQTQTPSGATQTYTLPMQNTGSYLNGQNLLTVLGFERWQPAIYPRIAAVLPDSRAAQAGFQADDVIVQADEQVIENWKQWVAYVSSHPEQAIRVQVLRAGHSIALILTPKALTVKKQLIGQAGLVAKIPPEIQTQLAAETRYGVMTALLAALNRTIEMSALTLRMFGKMITGEAALNNISGPISIAQYAGDSASLGIVPFLVFLAVVSISLGVINLLPIPLLDGGHLFYYAIEAIKGSPISEQALFWGQRVGLTLLLGLMSLAFYNDFMRVLGIE